MEEALLYETISNGKVQCNLCHFHCIIGEGKAGICKVRINNKGKLYTILDSYASSVQVDPIEKKPLFHFHPETNALSLGTWSCNFRCRGCQNYNISRFYPAEKNIKNISEEISPKKAIELAKSYGANGIAWTYNEPTIWFEYTLETAKLAKKEGLYTVYVTNGSITKRGLDLIGPYLDAFSVDIKAFSDESYRKITPIFDWHKILDTIVYAKTKWNIHIEVVTNIIPTIIPPTSIKKLEELHDVGIKEGLSFVYAGNILGHPYEDTYCPRCKRRVVSRRGFNITENNVHNGKCDFCGKELNIIE
jgi:pyruvate formate lyase activating enzyme